MFSVQFSKDGENFYTLIKFDARDTAEVVMKACAGHGVEFGHSYWRVRESANSDDFHAVIDR